MSEPCRLRRGEGYGACGDEGAPSFVDPKQLDELNIVCTKKEEEDAE
ncbi:MAG: hypothetical protein ACI3XJ_01540 [Oscillospiraceae bacterium]